MKKAACAAFSVCSRSVVVTVFVFGVAGRHVITIGMPRGTIVVMMVMFLFHDNYLFTVMVMIIGRDCHADRGTNRAASNSAVMTADLRTDCGPESAANRPAEHRISVHGQGRAAVDCQYRQNCNKYSFHVSLP